MSVLFVDWNYAIAPNVDYIFLGYLYRNLYEAKLRCTQSGITQWIVRTCEDLYQYEEEELGWIKIISYQIDHCLLFKVGMKGSRRRFWLDSSLSMVFDQRFFSLSLSLLWSFNSVRINCRKQISFSLVVRVWEILLRYLLSGFEVQMERERTWDFITIEKISLFISRQRRRRRCHHVWVHFLAWTASSRSPWRENEHECEKKR